MKNILRMMVKYKGRVPTWFEVTELSNGFVVNGNIYCATIEEVKEEAARWFDMKGI